VAQPVRADARLSLASIFNDSRQTNLKIYRTDLRQIFTTGRTLAVGLDDQSEISFSIPLQVRWHGNQFLSLDACG